MEKINRNYISLFEAIGLIKPVKNQPWGYSYHGFRYHDGSYTPRKSHKPEPARIYFGYQLLGSLRPFVKIGEDILNTFKPYVLLEKFLDDLLQPFNGMKNILAGAVSLITSVILLAGWTVLAPFALVASCIPYVNMFFAIPLLLSSAYPLSWGIEGIANIFRGVIQVATTPLNLVKLCLRGILTAVSYANEEKFLAEEKPEIQRLANQGLIKLQQIKEFENPFQNNEFGDDTESFVSRYLNDNMNQKKQKLAVHLQKNYKKGEKFTEDRINLFLHEINTPAFKALSDLPALMFEVDRKYSKSVNKGWDTNCKSNESIKGFDSMLGFFAKCSNESSGFKIKLPDREIIQNAENYFENFTCRGLI